MDSNEIKLLEAIHKVEKKVGELEVKIDDSVNIRYNHLENRVIKLEKIINWFAVAIMGAVLTAVLKLVIT